MGDGVEDDAAGAGAFVGEGDHVDEDLVNAAGVDGDIGQVAIDIEFELDIGGPAHGLGGLEGLAEEFADGDGFELEGNATDFDAGEVEHFVAEAEDAPGGDERLAEPLGLVVVDFTHGAFFKERDGVDDDGEGVAEVVGDAGEHDGAQAVGVDGFGPHFFELGEGAFEAVGAFVDSFFEGFVHPVDFDEAGDLIREEGEGGGGVGAEAVGDAAIFEVEGTDDFVAGDEGGAGDGAQLEVDDAGGVVEAGVVEGVAEDEGLVGFENALEDGAADFVAGVGEVGAALAAGDAVVEGFVFTDEDDEAALGVEDGEGGVEHGGEEVVEGTGLSEFATDVEQGGDGCGRDGLSHCSCIIGWFWGARNWGCMGKHR